MIKSKNLKVYKTPEWMKLTYMWYPSGGDLDDIVFSKNRFGELLIAPKNITPHLNVIIMTLKQFLLYDEK